MGWVRALRRRWWLTLLLLVLTLALTAVWAAKPGPYVGSSQVVLLPSKEVSGPAGGNPYLSFGDSITLTADLLRRELIAPPTVAKLAAAGYTSSYQVVDDPNVAGPVLDISVTGSSKTQVENTLNAVTSQSASTLAAMQATLSARDRITSLVVSITPNASLSVGKKLRTVLIVLGIGIILTIAIPQAVDAALRQRSRRNEITAERWRLRGDDLRSPVHDEPLPREPRREVQREPQPEPSPTANADTVAIPIADAGRGDRGPGKGKTETTSQRSADFDYVYDPEL